MYTYMYTYYCVYLRMSSSRHFGSVAIIGGLPPIHDIVQVCVCVCVCVCVQLSECVSTVTHVTHPLVVLLQVDE